MTETQFPPPSGAEFRGQKAFLGEEQREDPRGKGLQEREQDVKSARGGHSVSKR